MVYLYHTISNVNRLLSRVLFLCQLLFFQLSSYPIRPTSPEMFRNSFIKFPISYDWSHKYWRIVNVYYPYRISYWIYHVWCYCIHHYSYTRFTTLQKLGMCKRSVAAWWKGALQKIGHHPKICIFILKW
jgi:hypothetical protein